MVSKNVVLKELQPFRNNQRLIEHNQDATDIIQGMLKTHQKYFDEYDKISSFFFDTDVKKVCRDIWIFLKENVKYKIEPETKQTLRSPAGIIALGDSIGADCKSYSLFAAGILCSLQRKGQNINCCFRFASYKMFDKTPHHVFVVVNPNTKNEIWIDAVLDNFNEKKEYNYKTDKKLNMALYSMSGVNEVGNVFFEAKRLASGGIRNELTKQLSSLSMAFLYGYIPTGPFKENRNARDFFTYYNLPSIVRQKRERVYPFAQKIMKAVGMREIEFFGTIRTAIENETGKSPEQLVNELLGFDKMSILDKETMINGVGFIDTALTAFSALSSLLSSNVSITELDIKSFAPQSSDWDGWVNPINGKTSGLKKVLEETNNSGGGGILPSNNKLLMYGGIALLAYLLFKK